ncbi:succinate dehydrogenase [Primorskyibacter flagellatus]|uniref:Succinate dehydrogenase hydrophobic membrane anchor subunit n=1 Tax=Primorskyibacter flagellatus TaxID=1387277 RepID=A0A917ABH4_9RHOB|nr:succinate dehydrogenase, hydrophobic membrane anchor protein [Primorskyibacter flagellatus]GGE40273.1 succinate dehydrogenase [Primorskyibacter flagellatus]
MRYLTDRKRAVGSGSGSEGTHHHWKMMVSSICLAVIAPFFIFTFGAGLGSSFEEVQAFLSRPFVVLVLALGLIVGLNHFRMEIDEAVEDYVHGLAGKLTLIAVSAVTYLLMAVGLFALLKLAI